MEGESSSRGLFPETLGFDHRSISSPAGMDQDIQGSSMVLNSAETQNLSSYLLSSGEENASGQAYYNMSILNSAGTSSVGHSSDQEAHDETKMDLGWPASPSGSSASQADNMLSLEELDVNLNSTQVHVEQSSSFHQNSNMNDPFEGVEGNVSSVGDEVSQSGLFPCPYVPRSLEHQHGASSSDPQGSSGTVRFMSGDFNNRPGSSLDGRRVVCKRKSMEGLPGQSSASGSTNFFHMNENNSAFSGSVRNSSNGGINNSSGSSHISGPSSSREHLIPTVSSITGEVSRNAYPASSEMRNAERSLRNFRLRINAANERDVYSRNLFPSRNTIPDPRINLQNEQSSDSIPLNQRLESRLAAGGSSSQYQPRRSVPRGSLRRMDFHSLNGAPRNNGPLGAFNSPETSMGTRVDPDSGNSSRDVVVQPLHFPSTEIRNSVEESANWHAADEISSMAGAVPPPGDGTRSGVRSSEDLTWIAPPAEFSQGLAEAVRRTLFASVGSESRAQSSDILPQQSSHSSTSQEVHHQSGSPSRGSYLSQMRSAILLDRQREIRSLAAREGRNRVISEIRNALDLIRSREFEFDEAFVFDHPIFRGLTDAHDRHRDMRLDVDNMSYEELLALEERIGNVSTGLSEEMSLKCLKQWNHFPSVGEATTAPEPCSICREDYVEGEDLGALQCGHDFHTACIKKWLMIKNLCPICKKPALET